MPKSSNFLLLLLLGAGALLSACQSHDAVEPCDCPGIGGPAKWPKQFEAPVSGPDLSYHQPSYNPANPQQLVYRRGSRAELNQRVLPALTVGLWTGGVTDGQQRPLLLGYDILFDPNFGPDNWVAFQRGGQIWKAKTNGDSLQQLTFRDFHSTVRWSPDGLRLLCHTDNYVPGGPIQILDRNGRLLRSLLINYSRYALAWAPDGNSILIEYDPTGNNMGLATYDLRTGALATVATSPKSDPKGNGFVYGAAWLPDGKSILWCGDLGLYKTDLASRRTVRLRSGCLGRRYENPAVSADGRQIAVERTDQRVSDDGYSMHTEINIWMMDPDGSNERKVTF